MMVPIHKFLLFPKFLLFKGLRISSIMHDYCIHLYVDKGKPAEKQGRKTTDLN